MGASAIITLLGALLPSAITAAEKIFGVGSGPTKLQAVTAAVTPVLEAAATAGKTVGGVVPADVTTAIEAVLSGLKMTGAVPSDSTPAPVTGKTGTFTGTITF